MQAMPSDFARAQFSPEFEAALRPLMRERSFAKGVTLYGYGIPADGVYFVESGGVRVLLPSGDRQSRLLEVAGKGTILGLSETMCGESYRVSAEADEQTTVFFIARIDFMTLLNENHKFSMEVIRVLSDSLHGLYHRFRNVSAHPGRPRRRVPSEG